MHKLFLNGNVDDLPLPPIVSNIDAATYILAKFLSKLLTPLRKSEYTVKNTKNFVDNLKKENIQYLHKMVDFKCYVITYKCSIRLINKHHIKTDL